MAARQIDLCTCPPVLKGFRDAKAGSCHVYSPDGLNTVSLSQGSVLEAASEQGRQAEPTFRGKGEGMRSL